MSKAQRRADQDVRLLCVLLGLSASETQEVFALSGAARQSLDSVVRDTLYKLKVRVLGRIQSARAAKK